MTELARGFVDTTVQCWGCPVFDRLFQVISNAAASVYGKFAAFCVILLLVLLAFYILNAVWTNIKGGMSDPWYTKSLRPVLISAAIAAILLGMGVGLPRLLTSITFEPVAQIALTYTQSLTQTDAQIVGAAVSYQPEPMAADGFFRPELRNVIIDLMKTTITQFQSYMKLGIAVMDAAFSWRALLGIGAFIKHIIWFMLGLYLFYGFFKIFVRFCFYFADIIVAMAFFAFFFPLSLSMMAFKGASNMPQWLSGMGKGLGADQFKKLIDAIIGLAAAVITYTVIMVLIAKFFSAPGESAADLMTLILRGDVFKANLSEDNLATMTLMGAVVLVYIINFLYSQIPQVQKMVLSAFNVDANNSIGEQWANNVLNLADSAMDKVKQVGTTIISGGQTTDKKGDGK